MYLAHNTMYTFYQDKHLKVWKDSFERSQLFQENIKEGLPNYEIFKKDFTPQDVKNRATL